jgi:3-hydroxyisobutyrate dehydrogenase-like beta-hydroxyacid dehydrogenase
MGLAMARNVQQFLHREDRAQLRYWNRTASRGAPLESLGGIGCETITQLVAECDLIFISVSIWIGFQYDIVTMSPGN